MNVTIRQAALADVEAIARLFDGYREFYGQRANPDGAKKFIRTRLQERDSRIFLAMDDERGIGFTQLYPSFSSVAMQRIWILNDLFVDPAYRSRGVGRQLIDAAKAFAVQDGARRLSLATAPDNTTAQKLYEAAGYRRDSFFHYALELPE